MSIARLGHLPDVGEERRINPRTLESRLRRAVALTEPKPISLGVHSFASGGEVEVNWDGTPYDPVDSYAVPYFKLPEDDSQDAAPEMKGGAYDAIAEALSQPTFEASAEPNPPISYETRFEDVSRPVVEPTPPTFDAYQEPLTRQDVTETPPAPEQGFFQDALSGGIRLGKAVAPTVLETARVLNQTNPQGMAESARRLASGENVFDTLLGKEIPVLQQARDLVGEAYDKAAPVIKLGATATGIGLAADYIRGEEPGTTASQIGRGIATSIVPTRPGEVILEAAPGVGDIRGLAVGAREALLGEAGQVASRGGVGAGAIALGKRAADVAPEIARRAADVPIPTGAARGVDVPPALVTGEKTTPRLVSPTLGEGVPAMRGAAVVSPPTPPATAAPVTKLPDRGDAGIKAALAAKEEALLKPGAVFGNEGSIQRQVVGALNPSVDMPRNVNVAYNARAAVQASEYTDYALPELKAAREAKAAWADSAPAYIGPAENKVKGTLVDYFENPDFYKGVSPRLERAKDNWAQVTLDQVAKARSQFNVDIAEFKPAKPGAVYVPHIATRDSVEQVVERTKQSLASKVGIAKERGYESLAENMAKREGFKPETDLEALADLHSNALAYMSANETFKAGAGGKTKLEVINELHPGIIKQRDSLANTIHNLRQIRDNAARQGARQTGVAREAGRTTDALEKRAAVLDERIADLGEEYGPELSHLSGELYQLTRDLKNVRLTEADASRLAAASGMKSAVMRVQISRALDKLEELRTAVRVADTGDYVLSPSTFKYHMPEEAKAINSVLKNRIDNAFIEGVIGTADISRALALGPDFSPLAIHGVLGAMSHPEVAITNAVGLVKAGLHSPEKLLASVDPDLVRRYEVATNRSFGQMNPEFGLAKRGPELPGQPLKKFNDRLMNVVDYGRIKAFENDSNLLQSKLLGGLSQNQADHEAANALGKVIPQLNTVETGRSLQRSRLERFPVISPSFAAAPFELAKDFTSGAYKLATFNPGALRGREKLALIRGGTMIGTAITASVASALASAESNKLTPAEAVKEVLDPDSPRFMHIIIGKEASIPVGGPLRSAFVGVYKTATQGAPAGYRYARGRANPLLGNAWDVAVNRDYRGRAVREGSPWQQFTDSLQYLASNSNLLVAGGAEGYETGGVKGAAAGVGSQLTGTNIFERTPYDVTDRLVREEVENGTIPIGTFKDVDGTDKPIRTRADLIAASPLEAEAFDKRHGDLSAQRLENARPETQEAAKLDEDFRAAQKKRDTELLTTNPAQWRAESSAAARELGIRKDQIYGESDIKSPGLRGAVNEKYHEAIVKATKDGKVDWDRVDLAVAGFSPDEQRLLFETQLRGETDARKQYLKDIKELAPYFDQRDEAWAVMTRGDPKLAQYNSLDELRMATIQELVKPRSEGGPGYGWSEARSLTDKKLAPYSEKVGEQANKYLAEHADVLLPLLDKYDFYVPAKFQRYIRK